MPRERVRTTFLTGVAVLVPVVISVWVLVGLVRFVDSLLDPITLLVREHGYESAVTVALLELSSLVIVGALVVGVGAVVRVRVGRDLKERVDGLLERIPVLGVVYRAGRQMSDSLVDPETDERTSRFQNVKLVEFPEQGEFRIGFLTREDPPDTVVATAREFSGRPDGEYRTVFLPTAPNPFVGGHLTHVPVERVLDLDLTVESAVQYYVTGGIAGDPGEE